MLNWTLLQATNLKHTHSKATGCVEYNDIAFTIFFATSTNSAPHPDAKQDEHVDSARVLPRLKLTVCILLHRRQCEKVA